MGTLLGFYQYEKSEIKPNKAHWTFKQYNKGGKMFLFLHRNVKALTFGPFIHPDVMQETPGIDKIFF